MSKFLLTPVTHWCGLCYRHTATCLGFSTGVHTCYVMPHFPMGTWKLNSSSLACAVGTLPRAISPAPRLSCLDSQTEDSLLSPYHGKTRHQAMKRSSHVRLYRFSLLVRELFETVPSASSLRRIPPCRLRLVLAFCSSSLGS